VSHFRGRASAGLRRIAGSASSLGPGLVDAGLSSLAGFAASLYAVRSLHAADLGAFSLYLAAVTVASLLPQQLIFLPAQVAALDAPRDMRVAILRQVVLRGVLVAAIVAPAAALSGVIVAGDVSASTLMALATGAAALIVLSPAQDHVRSALYLADAPRQAAGVSAVQLALTAGALGSLHLAGLPAAWVPFTALAIAATGSAAWGLATTAGSAGPVGKLPPWRELVRPGRALLPAALIQEGTIFVSAALLAAIASATTLGSAEAARIVSRPVQVLSLGVSRSMAPRLMEAGRERSTSRAKGAALIYVLTLAGAGLAYVALTGWPHSLNPFDRLVPVAYALEGLVALILLATFAGAIGSLPRAILIAGRKERELLVITVLASLVRVAAVVLLAASIGAYALPVSQLLGVVVSGGLGARAAAAALDRR